MNNWLGVDGRLKLGDTRSSTPFKIPKRASSAASASGRRAAAT